jgi:hypothetical protein
MSSPRPLALALALVLAAGPAARAAPPPERFVPRDVSMAVLIPSLQVLSRQASDLLDTAASFPGGDKLLDARAVLARRLGFDLLDTASVKAAGLDPRGGAAVALRMLGPSDQDAEVVFSLPVASAARFEASFGRIAREQLRLRAHEVQRGKPAVTVWRAEEGGRIALACAQVEGTALVGFGPRAVEQVRAAAAVRRDEHVGTAPEYRTVLRALGGGLAVVAFIPSGSYLARDTPALDRGFGAGLAAARDRLRLPLALVLDERSRLLAAGTIDARPLLEKLDPGTTVVIRNSTDLRAFLPPEDLEAMLRKQRSPEGMRTFLRETLPAVGSGLVLGFGLVPVAGGADAPSIDKETLAFFRLELAVGLSDPARMKRAIRRALTENASGKTELPEDGPWIFPVPGGEAGVTVAEDRLLVAMGPTGCLQALAHRTGTTFHPPTPASSRAFAAPLSALLVDVPALLAGVKAIPREAYRDNRGGGADSHRTAQEVVTTLSRIRVLSGSTELVGTAQRTELVLEVQPPDRD